MRRSQRGVDPRDEPERRLRERGERKWRYGYSDIAAAAGLTRGTVKVYASLGKFDPLDLASVARFIVAHRLRGSAPFP